jgi:hypothetical protein
MKRVSPDHPAVAAVISAPNLSALHSLDLELFDRPSVHPGGLWHRPGPGPAFGRRPLPVLGPALPLPVPVAVPAADPDWEAVEDVPWADRRIADRVAVRLGARVEAYRWGRRVEMDLAAELVNVSESGIGLRLVVPVYRGEKLDLTLWAPGAGWCGRGAGIVRWAVVGEGGSTLAGVRLGRRLTARVLRELT